MKHREEKFEGEVGKVFTLCSEGDENFVRNGVIEQK